MGMIWKLTPSAAFIVACVATPSATAKTKFVEFDPPGFNSSITTALNKNGDVVVYTDPDGATYHGFLRTADGAFIEIAPGSDWVQVYTINNRDASAGIAKLGGAVTSFVGNPDGSITPFDGGHPYSINDKGEIAGEVYDGVSFRGFYRAKNGNITIFDAPNAGTQTNAGTRAVAINKAGTIAGFFTDPGSVRHGYTRSRDGIITVIDIVDGSHATDIWCINDKGAVGGRYYDQDGQHPFLRNADGTLISFDIPDGSNAYVYGVNSRGDAVGSYVDFHQVSHGFVRMHNGKLKVIDSPHAGKGTFQGTEAGSINDSGNIAGYYIDKNDVAHSFVSEP